VGVTTQRDCGSPDLGVLRLRDAINAGIVTGPTIVASGPCVTTTGGHGDFIGLTADSAPELRGRVHELHDAGVDFIKVMASGGDMDPGTNRRKPQFSTDELRALVQCAHDHSLLVVAHCNPTESIRQAVEAGVDTIAHCNWLGEAEGTIDYDPDVAARLLERGTFIDLNIDATIRPYVDGDGWSQEWTEEFHPKNRWETHDQLRSRGARLLFTSDEFGYRTAGFPSLLARLVAELGMDVVEVIHRATAVPAQAIGLSDELGTISTGRRANLVLLEGDIRAASAPSALQSARTVWVDGRVVSSLGQLSPPPIALMSGAFND
jgi:imidazolonepropionase-like amidohydrolase